MISHYSANQMQGPFSGHVSQVAWFFADFAFAFDICLHSLKGSTLDSEDVFHPNNILPNLLHLCSWLYLETSQHPLCLRHTVLLFPKQVARSAWIHACHTYPFLNSGNSGIPTPVFLPEKSHGQRRLEGYSPRGHKESDTTERLNDRDAAPDV